MNEAWEYFVKCSIINRDWPKTMKLVEDAFFNYLLIADDLHHPALVTWEVLHYYDKSLV